MLRTFIVRISIISLILFVTIGLSFCGNIASEAKSMHAPPVNQDSVNEILHEINADAKIKKLEELYQKRIQYGFNGCVLIAQRGQVLFKKAYGFSSFKTKDTLKVNTAFQLASASKPFTATAILMLMERGKLKLTDKVNQYIQGFPYSDVTIQMLLTHRSGLNNYIYFGEPFCSQDKCYKGQPYDNDAVIEIMNATKPAPYCPANTKFGYCNTNYVLLASIVEKISGLSFADFMKENIFIPLKMNNTWVHTPNSKTLHRNIALGHKISGQVEDNTYADEVIGDKGVYSTVEDMFKWDRSLYTEQLLKQETLDKAFTGYSNEHRGKRNYGLGWRIIDHGQGKKDVYHNGWWHGYNITFYRRMANETTIIILSNKNNKCAYLINDILSIMDGKAEAEPLYKNAADEFL